MCGLYQELLSGPTELSYYGSMILRLSQKLSTKIKAGTLNAMPLDDNPYADWSCHLFTVDRTQYILVSNTQLEIGIETGPT
jgi:hypothetical protein